MSDKKTYPPLAPDEVAAWKSSYWIVALVALFIGGLTILSSLAVDRLAHHVVRPVYASDLLAGTVAALFSGFALFRMQVRKRELLTRMQIVEDVNHHVRNALTAITLSASLQQDPELNDRVRDAADRIDWVLNHVLSHTVLPQEIPSAHPLWSSGRRLTRTPTQRRDARKP